MVSNVLSNFSSLDELIQVIYQGVHTFIALSNISEYSDEWSIHVSCEGRWWSGLWTSQDILKIVGDNPSDFLLEQFSEKLSEAFVQGQLCITDWDESPGSNIKFTIGPSSQRPIHISLTEMGQCEGAEYAASVLKEIALQAKSRRCRIRADDPLDSLTFPSPSATTVKEKADIPAAQPSAPRVASAPDAKKKEPEVTQELPAKLAKKRQLPPNKSAPVQASSGGAKPKHAGASLAHPNKKARRFQAVELGSDSDDE